MTVDLAPFALPTLRKVFQSSVKNTIGEAECFWDVKFYPHDTADNAAPVFAVSNKNTIFVARIANTETGDIEILRTFTVDSGDEDRYLADPQADLFVACAWAFLNQDEPLLLGAGDNGLIRVFNVVQGGLETTLQGHGHGSINDLAVHPLYPWIVASASQDTSIRVWDLRRSVARHESPSIIICGHGHGHLQSILTVAWHDSGRYLISGGHDNRICVWTLPDLAPESSFWEEISPRQRERTSDEIRVIHFPHLVTSAVHSSFVDCVRFYNDRVLSKSSEECKIVLWEITGFASNLPPPDNILAPKGQDHLDTRNGFMRTQTTLPSGISKVVLKQELQDKAKFTRLLEFSVPECTSFYMRFELLKPSARYPNIHPVLAIGNNLSQVFFWDLDALNLGYDGTVARSRKGGRSKRAGKAGPQTTAERGTRRQTSPSSAAGQAPAAGPPRVPTPFSDNSSTGRASPVTQHTPSLDHSDEIVEPQADRERFPLDDPHTPVKAQCTVQLKPKTLKADLVTTTRSISWSPDGKWCIATGGTFEYVGSAGPHGRRPGKERRLKGIGFAGIMGRWTS
ncbi:hypothetical protein DV735_g4453, partial [Chaetothyriales sp. CBS 134920]